MHTTAPSSPSDTLLRRTQALILAALGATALLLVYAGWLWDHDAHQGAALSAVSREVMNVRGEIMRLDEVLTNAARMAAVTGDLEWERRYSLNERALESALKRARELAPNAYVGGWVAIVEAANTQLVVMERRAFELISQGQREQAAAIFESSAYAQQKERYAGGMGSMSAALEREVARWEKQMIERTHQNLFYMAVGGILVVGFWSAVVVVLRRWRRHVMASLRAREAAEAYLRTHRDQLEQAVTERTQALSTVNARLVEEIDQRIKMETVLRVERDRAEEASRAKTEFLAHMSHELRTPLNAIIGFSEAMNHELLGPLGQPRYKEYIAGITESGSHLLGLIGDILDVARIESEAMSLQEAVVDVGTELESARRLFTQKIEMKKIAFAVQGLEAPIALWADGQRLRQVFVNLLSNAVKFAPVSGAITVRARRTLEGLVLTISDTGPGIPAGQIEAAFSPFARTTQATVAAGTGAGLGLPIAKALVEAHGGSLSIESRAGEGTTIRIVLPQTRLDQAEAALAETQNEIEMPPLKARAAG
jgi:signal transduction histidine kinase